MSEKILSGKVREVYDAGQGRLFIVATDRISAFDVVYPTLVPRKGEVLNGLSLFWFEKTRDIVENHVISADSGDFPPELRKPEYAGRAMLARKLKMLPYEFIVRGYLFGAMWEGYKKNGEFFGYAPPLGLELAQKLEKPVLTPSLKVSEGHDEYISVKRLKDELGGEMSARLEEICIALYERCAGMAERRGIIIADTKFEFGLSEEGRLVLADELFTPDSSRFWDAAEYKTGQSPKSFDKQFLRDWLTREGLAGVCPPPPVPDDIVSATAELYQKCYERLAR
ncbi:MAG: phosphoribosylaminoimidazolesuccinocarboxamide synthase [Clostridiales bacterium]|nr:phosphoribosylaminoimidazolesuccinocarboxamide synthase [Clostridiales bacterium]